MDITLSVQEKFNAAAAALPDDYRGEDFALRAKALFHLGTDWDRRMMIQTLQTAIVGETNSLQNDPIISSYTSAHDKLKKIGTLTGLFDQLLSVDTSLYNTGSPNLLPGSFYSAMAEGFLTNAADLIDKVAPNRGNEAMLSNIREVSEKLVLLGINAKKAAGKYNNPTPILPPAQLFKNTGKRSL